MKFRRKSGTREIRTTFPYPLNGIRLTELSDSHSANWLLEAHFFPPLPFGSDSLSCTFETVFSDDRGKVCLQTSATIIFVSNESLIEIYWNVGEANWRNANH